MKNIKKFISVILAILCVLCFASCGNTNDNTTTEKPETESTTVEGNETESSDLWSSATYTVDTQLGVGAKTLVCEVKAEDKTVTFTIKTDKDTVGAALLENQIIAGEEGPYGLYVKVVNGITADYDINQRYWAFYIDGEMANTGVDGTEITEGVTYQFVYSK